MIKKHDVRFYESSRKINSSKKYKIQITKG